MKIERNRAVGAYRAAAGRQPQPPAAGDGASRGVIDTATVFGIPETELTEKVRDAIGALLQEVDDLRQSLRGAQGRLAELEALADADGLTPLLNRRAFVRELGRMVAYSRRYGAPASLVYFDLNAFKAINDSFGHHVGDEALIHIAKLLVEQTRASDVVGRLGGDEFGVVLAQATEEVARGKAEALRGTIAARPLVWHDQAIPLTASYGVYVFRADTDPDQALAEADRSMYLNKDTRRLASPG
jgi:diguanylate cyclase (GGDEF)-like protein